MGCPSALQNAASQAEMHELTIMSSPSALQNAAFKVELHELTMGRLACTEQSLDEARFSAISNL